MQVDDSTERILGLIRERGAAGSGDVASLLGVSRQAAYRRLRSLVDAGVLVQEGAARATRYRLSESRWERRFDLEGLAEDEVHRQVVEEVPAVGRLQGNPAAVVGYVVTELVNNAIDHSQGQSVRVAVVAQASRLVLEIEDDGVGAFAHVRAELGLESELAALQELSKGRTTTAPQRHTGEGLFFVSKVVDVFRLEAGRLAWIVDNERDDMAAESLPRARRGTLARAELAPSRARELRQVFEEFTEDFEFVKTRTVVKLFALGVRFISRSEAKRLLHGLERFREVILDFAGVEAVGQGFADEVFRVWQRAHPEVTLRPVNMVEAVDFMVRRAQART